MSLWLLAVASLARPCRCDPALADRVAELEARNAALVARIEALEGGRAAPSEPSVGDEEAAAALLQEISAHVEALAFDEAKAKMAQLARDYARTQASRAAERLRSELDIIGREVPPLRVERWYQGSTEAVEANRTQLLVFFEVWCPHCKREVPKLEATWKKFGSEGLSVVGLTKLTRGVTEAQLEAFIAENRLTYPIAKEEGEVMSEICGVQGIPAAAIVRDGKIVWRGHPARLTDEILRKLIAGD